MDREKIREDFPLLSKPIGGYPLIYFDSAATTQKPRAVFERLHRFYSTEYGTVHRALYSLSRQSSLAYQEAREKIQRFLNAERPEEIIFTRGTTAGINLLARSLGHSLRAGDRIVLTEVEHHSNLVPWQIIAQEKGAELIFIPVNERGDISVEELPRYIDARTKIVSLPHVSNVLGTIFPLKEVVEAARRVGAYLIVDGAQGAAHLPVDVQELDVDFYLFSGHKAYGPTGVGVLYGKYDLLKVMPPVDGGGDMINQVSLHSSTYAEPPLRFEAGTPMFAEVIGLGTAIDYLESIGMREIMHAEEELVSLATTLLSQVEGLRFIGEPQQRSSIISFVIERVHPLDLATLLDCRGIAMRSGHQCSQTTMQRFKVPSVSRISFGLYNTPDEVSSFYETLIQLLPKLQATAPAQVLLGLEP